MVDAATAIHETGRAVAMLALESSIALPGDRLRQARHVEGNLTTERGLLAFASAEIQDSASLDVKRRATT